MAPKNRPFLLTAGAANVLPYLDRAASRLEYIHPIIMQISY